MWQYVLIAQQGLAYFETITMAHLNSSYVINFRVALASGPKCQWLECCVVELRGHAGANKGPNSCSIDGKLKINVISLIYLQHQSVNLFIKDKVTTSAYARAKDMSNDARLDHIDFHQLSGRANTQSFWLIAHRKSSLNIFVRLRFIAFPSMMFARILTVRLASTLFRDGRCAR